MDQEVLVTIAGLRAENEKLRHQTRVLPDGTIEYHDEVGPLELLKLALDDCLAMVKAGDLSLWAVTEIVAGEYGQTADSMTGELEID